MPERFLTFVTSRLLPRHLLFLASQISLAHFFRNISTNCQQIPSVLSTLTNSSQLVNGAQISATAVTQPRGPFKTCFNWFCLRIMDRCILPRNPTIHTVFHLLNALKLGCPIPVANCFKENSVCFRLIGGLPSASPKSDELLLSSGASYASEDNSGNGGQSEIPATSVFRSGAGGWNIYFGRPMG